MTSQKVTISDPDYTIFLDSPTVAVSRRKAVFFKPKVEVSNGNLNYGLHAGILKPTFRRIENLECVQPHTVPWQEEVTIQVEKAKRLQKGWDGYSAPIPTKESLSLAEGYLEFLIAKNEEPHRVGPAALGGMAFIHKRGVKEVYVLISNEGEILVMFMDDKNIPDPISFDSTPQGYDRLIEEIRDHLG